MTVTIIESPVVGGGAPLPSQPSTTGDFDFPRHSDPPVALDCNHIPSSGRGDCRGSFLWDGPTRKDGHLSPTGFEHPANTQKEPGLASNGEVRQELRGLSVHREILALNQEDGCTLGDVPRPVRRCCVPDEDSRQVASPNDIYKPRRAEITVAVPAARLPRQCAALFRPEVLVQIQSGYGFRWCNSSSVNAGKSAQKPNPIFP